jgi:hypothetical protein
MTSEKKVYLNYEVFDQDKKVFSSKLIQRQRIPIKKSFFEVPKGYKIQDA